LKSYSLLNRTAFRKIVKKYNKTVNDPDAGDGQDYMRQKVNKSQFVSSEEPDTLIQDIEGALTSSFDMITRLLIQIDLYARYFERGNHKVAVGKLRAKTTKASDYGGPMFRTGAMMAIGVVFGIEGLVYAANGYYDALPGSEIQTQTSYLLQLYGGYFAFLALAYLFVLDAWVFETYRVNYVFIFELDTRNPINWRRMAELPSAFACLLGVCMWLNFSMVGGDAMYLYWPVVLIGVCSNLALNSMKTICC
jgi:xenotropic and polytropic retrovirus receptor 1